MENEAFSSISASFINRTCSFAHASASETPYVSHIYFSDPKVLMESVLFLPSARMVFMARYVMEFLFLVHPNLIINLTKTERRDFVHRGHCKFHSQSAS